MHGLRPVAISMIQHPNDQISIAPNLPVFSPLIVSGDIYIGVPVNACDFLDSISDSITADEFVIATFKSDCDDDVMCNCDEIYDLSLPSCIDMVLDIVDVVEPIYSEMVLFALLVLEGGAVPTSSALVLVLPDVAVVAGVVPVLGIAITFAEPKSTNLITPM